MKASKYNCPLCKKSLTVLHFHRDNSVTIYCGNKECNGIEAAYGGAGATEDAAFRALLLSVNSEDKKHIK